MQEPPNPYPQYPQQQWQPQSQPLPPQQQWQQQPPYPLQQYQQQPQYQPSMQPPKKKSRKRLWLILAAVVLVLAVIIGVASLGQGQKPTPAVQATQPIPATQVPTKAPVPNFARLGGTVHDFDLKFGKEDTSNGSIGYQPFGSYTSGQDLPTDKIYISVENGHVDGVTVTLPKDSPLSWQDGLKFCRSFLPADAIFQSDKDFSPPTQDYQEIYMSKTMAHMFSAVHFVEGRGINPQPLTPGTLQIMYYYSSWYDHTTNGVQITSCDIELGQPN